MDEVRSFLMGAKCPLVLGVSETWLDSSVTNGEIDIKGYCVSRRDRGTRGGGVLVYIPESCHSWRRRNLEDNSIEAVWNELHLRRKDVSASWSLWSHLAHHVGILEITVLHCQWPCSHQSGKKEELQPTMDQQRDPPANQSTELPQAKVQKNKKCRWLDEVWGAEEESSPGNAPGQDKAL